VSLIHITDGDLFASGAEAFVNPVNCVGVAGKGLALEFKRRFPDNYAAYRLACEEAALRVGRPVVFELPVMRPRRRPWFIINFPTKDHWRRPSRLEWIESGLEFLLADVRQLSILSIAMPALGCGLGGLPWSEVRPLIEHFALSTRAQVMVFAPRFSSGAGSEARRP